MPFVPCLSVPDTAASIAFYKKLGFEVDSSTAKSGDDIHMLLYQGGLCGMLYGHANLKAWLPVLANTPIGFSGMFYLSVSDFDGVRERVGKHAKIVKDTVVDNNGQREFYFRDLDGYVIGVNDRAALQASELGKYA